MKFLQSAYDFPLAVALGDKTPSWGLSRWGGNGGLRFVPPDDEGFTLRGDKRRLVYKGRRRSHRFTILGDNAFEYDCILEKPPDTNTVTLFMEGAENFDFFRQPDFLKEPLLAGSYAVYKKETLVGEGTGKLCHIHRPEIIDARGRRVLGDLSVEGNRLCIAIPEKWLGDAKYPVVVDPTIGTATVGYQTNYYNEDNEYQQLFFEFSIGVNRFLLAETFNGMATAYVYAYEKDYQGRCRPVIYSDNNNVPLARRSVNERDFDIAVGGGKTAGWRSATFSTNTSLESGTYVWFGVFCDWFAPRFDYGAKCYWDYWDHLGTEIPNTYPVWSANWYYNFKLSVYFTYTAVQNYVRKLTQGVTLADSRVLRADFRRSMAQTVRANGTAKRFLTVCRKFVEAVRGLDKRSVSVLFVRSVHETAEVADTSRHWGAFLRGLVEQAHIAAEARGGWVLLAKIADTVQAAGAVFRGLVLFVRIVTGLFVRDYLLGRFLKAREEIVLKSAVCREIVLDSRID